MRVGDLQSHARLAGDGLDDADRDHRQGARQVLHQVDDLAALHAHRGLDLIARDHGPRIRGEHLHRDAEVGELLLDQARGELDRLRADALALGLRLVQELERRQRRVGQLLEEPRLLLLVHALRLLDLDHRRLDAQRRMVFLALFLRLDHELAFLARELARAPVLSALPCAAREDTGRLEDEADEFRDGEPGDAGEETQADGGERHEHERRAGEAERHGERAADDVAHQAAWRERQVDGQAMQARSLERRAAEQEQRETAGGEADRAGIKSPVTPQHGKGAQRHQPVGRETEEVKKDIGKPGADGTSGVARHRVRAGVRPAGIAAMVGDENQQQVERQRTEEQPLRFAYQPREPGRKRRRAALVHYGQATPAA